MPSEATNKLLLATVTAVSGTAVTCTPDGSVSSVTAVDCCGARAGDRVVAQWHYTQLLAIAVVGGPRLGADRIVDVGVSQDWYYQLYASGYIRAHRVVTMSTDTLGFSTANVPLPCTMVNTDYAVEVNAGIGNVTSAYDIYANRTVSQIVVALYVSSTGSWLPTTGVSLTLDGFVHGSIPPSGDRLPDYTGATTVTPSRSAQTLATADTSVLQNIVIEPIPSNYGLITTHGSVIEVS